MQSLVGKENISVREVTYRMQKGFLLIIKDLPFSLKSKHLIGLIILILLQLSFAATFKVAAQGGNIIASINFDPKTDGFAFENYGNGSRQWQNDLTAEDMIRFFGAKPVCASGDSASNCVLNTKAAEWMKKQLEGMNEGHCEGMATAAARMKFSRPFKNTNGLPSGLQSGVSRVFDLKLDQIIGNYVAYYFVTQGFSEVSTPTTETSKLSPVGIVNAIAEMMKGGKDSYTLGFYKYDRATGKKSAGHAITPIAVEDAGDTFRIHVYDNNYPGTVRYVIVEKGGKQSWKYVSTTKPGEPVSEYEGDVDTKTLEVTASSLRDKTCYEAPFADPNAEKLCAGSAPAGTPVATETKGSLGGERAQFFMTNEGNLLVTAPDGKRLGYDPETNRFYQEITGGMARLLVGGRGFDIPDYTVPVLTSGDAYQITFSGKDLTAESKTNFAYSAPGLTVGFEDIRLDPQETLTTTISPNGETITFTSSADAETPSIYFAFDAKDGSGASYRLEIGGAQIEAGKTLTAEIDFENLKASFKDDDGNGDTYDIELVRINPDGTRRESKKQFKEEGDNVEVNLDDFN